MSAMCAFCQHIDSRPDPSATCRIACILAGAALILLTTSSGLFAGQSRQAALSPKSRQLILRSLEQVVIDRHSHDHVRTVALAALVSVRKTTPAVAAAIRDILDDSSADLYFRQSAVHAVSEFEQHDAETLVLLRKLAHDPDSLAGVRVGCASALTETAERSFGLSVLRNVLADESVSDDIRNEAIVSLVFIAEDTGRQTLNVLLDLCDSPNPAIREMAPAWLGDFPDKKPATDRLLTIALDNTATRFGRRAAIDALVKLQFEDPQGLKQLRAILHDPGVPVASLFTELKLDDAATLKALRNTAANPVVDHGARYRAVLALAALDAKGDSTIECLQRILNEAPPTAINLLSAVAETLQKSGADDAATLTSLKSVRNDPRHSAVARVAASAALLNLGLDQEVVFLRQIAMQKDAGFPARRRAFKALADAAPHDHDTQKIQRSLIEDSATDAFVRSAAGAAMAAHESPDARSLQAFRNVLMGRWPIPHELKESATAALKRWSPRDPEVLRHLRSVMVTRPSPPGKVGDAARLAGRLCESDKKTLAVMRQLAVDPDTAWGDRTGAVRGLVLSGDRSQATRASLLSVLAATRNAASNEPSVRRKDEVFRTATASTLQQEAASAIIDGGFHDEAALEAVCQLLRDRTVPVNTRMTIAISLDAQILQQLDSAEKESEDSR